MTVCDVGCCSALEEMLYDNLLRLVIKPIKSLVDIP